MTKQDNSGNAFPDYQQKIWTPGELPPDTTPLPQYSPVGGLTKRELFAALALQALMARDTTAPGETWGHQKVYYANIAVEQAEALLARLAEKDDNDLPLFRASGTKDVVSEKRPEIELPDGSKNRFDY